MMYMNWFILLRSTSADSIVFTIQRWIQGAKGEIAPPPFQYVVQRRMRVKKYWGGGAEYHVAVGPWRRVWEGGCAPSHAEHEENFAGIYIKWKQYCITN